RKDGMLQDAMKNRIGVIVLVVVCVGLGIGLISIKRQSDKQKEDDQTSIQNFSNKLVVAASQLDETKQVNAELRKDLDNEKKNYSELTNNYSQVAANLSQTEASLRTSEQEVAKRDVRIVELESQNKALDRRAQDLGLEITKLTANIDATQAKAPKPNYDVNVEVTSDGSVRVIPPLTNGPAATATSPSAQ